MAEDSLGKKASNGNVPFVMDWVKGPPTCHVRKEDFAKRRPKMAIPVSMVWLKDPTRHLLKEKAVVAHTDSDDAAPPARSDS